MKTAVVDSDALIALLNKDDALADEALQTLENLHRQEFRLLYPVTAITEATTTLQRKLSNSTLAAALVKMINESQLHVVAVDQEILKLAGSIFRPSGSKQNTLFDAVIAAVTKQYEADAVFSFDVWYEKIGLTLASRL